MFFEKYQIDYNGAEGNGNIFARYQDKVQNGSYSLVLIFCDTERKPYEQYEDIKRKIDNFYGKEGASSNVIIFANPCTMQIVIKHWEDIVLKSNQKKKNSTIIKRLNNIENYKGKKSQIDEMMKQINIENYNLMKERISKYNQNDNIVGSSNFIKFILNLENDDCKWIEDIDKQLWN